MGQYQDLKSKFAKHTLLCTKLMEIFNKRSLSLVSTFEQDLVMTKPSENSKQFYKSLISILSDVGIEHFDKVRALMLYVVAREGISDADRQTFLSDARLTLDETQAISNMSMLSVLLSSKIDENSVSNREAKNPYNLSEKILRSRGKEVAFENSRYTPTIKFIVDDQIKNVLDQTWFPWVQPPSIGNEMDTISGVVGRAKVKPSWATKKRGPAAPGEKELVVDLRSNGPRIVVFVIGGVCDSEILALRACGTDNARDIIVGSSHTWTPDSFVEALKYMNRKHASGSLFVGFQRPVVKIETNESDEESGRRKRETGGSRNDPKFNGRDQNSRNSPRRSPPNTRSNSRNDIPVKSGRNDSNSGSRRPEPSSRQDVSNSRRQDPSNHRTDSRYPSKNDGNEESAMGKMFGSFGSLWSKNK